MCYFPIQFIISILPSVIQTQSVCTVILNHYIKCIYCLILHYFIYLLHFISRATQLLLYKLIIAITFFASTVPRSCPPKLFFCIPYRWPTIHKTRLPASSLLIASHNCDLFRTRKGVFCFFAFICLLHLFIVSFLEICSEFVYCWKCYEMIPCYLPPIFTECFILISIIISILTLLLQWRRLDN